MKVALTSNLISSETEKNNKNTLTGPANYKKNNN